MNHAALAGRMRVCMLTVMLPALSSSTLAAQTLTTPAQPQQPNRQGAAVFGGAQRPQRDIVALSVSLYGAYDQPLLASGEEDPGLAGLANGGPFSGLDGRLTITPALDGRFRFGAEANTGMRYYGQLSELVASSQAVSAGATFQITRQTAINGRGGFSYTPYFDFATAADLDPTVPDGPGRLPDDALASRRTRAYEGSFDLTHTVAERTSYTLRYAARQTELIGEPQSSLDTTISGVMSRRFGRRTTTRVNFSHRDGEFTRGDVRTPVKLDDLEFVLDREWARSPTRRTTFTFSLGPSRVDYAGRELYRAFGGAGVRHPLGRSWDLRANYRRGVNFLESTARPMLSDSAVVSVSGLLTRRVDLSLSAAAVRGEVGIDATGASYDSYAGTVALRYAMTRSLALSADYLYNFQQFSEQTATASGRRRSGVRVGLSWYVPIVQQRVRPEPVRRQGQGQGQ